MHVKMIVAAGPRFGRFVNHDNCLQAIWSNAPWRRLVSMLMQTQGISPRSRGPRPGIAFLRPNKSVFPRFSSSLSGLACLEFLAALLKQVVKRTRMAGRRTIDAETERLAADARREQNWKRWGPYLAERQWGVVREDYSPDGSCWEFFPHAHAHSRAYRWGEDGLLGITDRECRLCFAIALWNGRDPILKERLFGLTNAEGNHGEDVKECYSTSMQRPPLRT